MSSWEKIRFFGSNFWLKFFLGIMVGRILYFKLIKVNNLS